ncbi:MAG: hypothetical protein QOG80_309 [Pseudonocardiales bacterium]|jgi:hypothetical protein|nr:hypothetical protein [Pseudonocardiales bacterium]
MTEVHTRRPLPALICLLALTLLTALVWWRVLNRDSGGAQAKSSCTTQTTQTTLPPTSSVSLSVLNSTQRKGLAKATAATLGKLGFKINGYANDSHPIAGVAEIRFGPDQKDAATLLGYYFPRSTLVPLPATSQGKVVVSLGSKYTAVTSAAKVKAALAAAHVRVAAPGSAQSTTTATC